jgi:hypothetical protein
MHQVVNFGSSLADTAAESLMIEWSKLEPTAERGTLQVPSTFLFAKKHEFSTQHNFVVVMVSAVVVSFLSSLPQSQYYLTRWASCSLVAVLTTFGFFFGHLWRAIPLGVYTAPVLRPAGAIGPPWLVFLRPP